MSARDDEDFVAYVTGRMPVLRRMAVQLAGDPHRGDDLVQQAITRLYIHWRRASTADSLDAYLYKILVRVFLDERRLKWTAVRLRGSPAEPLAGERPATIGHAAQDPAASVADRMLLRDALATLPPRQRAVVVLRFLADRSVDEVASILNVTPGTVKSQTHAGLNALRRLLSPDGPSGGSSPGAAPSPTLNLGVM